MIYPCDILHQNWPKCSWEENLILERGALALDLKIPPVGDDDCNRVSSKMTISMQKSKKCKTKVGSPLNLKSHRRVSEAQSKKFYFKKPGRCNASQDAQSQKSLQYI